jgi:hypothetical protein
MLSNGQWLCILGEVAAASTRSRRAVGEAAAAAQ